MAILSSKWDKLHDSLIARFYEVDKSGKRISANEVRAPLTESTMDLTLNWQSPFENMGAESKAPALLAMLQSGSLQPVITALKPSGSADVAAGEAQKSASSSNSFITQFEGRSGITKLNSTQIFVGMPPVKFTVNALFRAWENPAEEVSAPVNQLIEWALSKELSPDGAVVKSIEHAKGNGDSAVEILMPSLTPSLVCMEYKGRVYSPLVIESIGYPMDAPNDGNGHHTYQKIPMTFGTLTAIDRKDWANSDWRL